MKLYEIDEAILECINSETGEILDEEKLAQLQFAREEKIKAVGEWYKNTMAEVNAYKAEKDSFAEKQKKAERKAESLKNWLAYALQGERFKTTTVQIAFRKSEKTVVDDITKLDSKFYKPVKVEADLTKIKAAIKAGEVVEGCHIESNNNISIK